MITNRNRPVARLVAVTPPRERPVFGSAKAAFEPFGTDPRGHRPRAGADGRGAAARVGHRVSRWLADACALIDFYLGRSGTARVHPEPVRDRHRRRRRRRDHRLGDRHQDRARQARGLPQRRSRDARAACWRRHGFDLLALDAVTAEQAARLPALHADPFDRRWSAGPAHRPHGADLRCHDGRYGVPVSLVRCEAKGDRLAARRRYRMVCGLRQWLRSAPGNLALAEVEARISRPQAAASSPWLRRQPTFPNSLCQSRGAVRQRPYLCIVARFML